MTMFSNSTGDLVTDDYLDGKDAYDLGLDTNDNPNPDGTAASNDWINGYWAADRRAGSPKWNVVKAELDADQWSFDADHPTSLTA